MALAHRRYGIARLGAGSEVRNRRGPQSPRGRTGSRTDVLHDLAGTLRPDEAIATPRDRRWGRPEGVRSRRPRSSTQSARVLRRFAEQRNRHLAGRRIPREVVALSRLRRRITGPLSAEDWRRQRPHLSRGRRPERHRNRRTSRGGSHLSLDANLRSCLSQLTVLELGDESGDYGAMLLAGLGANVIKIEALEGSPSRSIGPFAASATARDPEASLFFWRYNLNKKSVALDLSHPDAGALLSRMADRADIVLLSGEFAAVDAQLDLWRGIAAEKRHLIVCSLTPFGLDGPYRDFKSTDLTQMALGGIMAMCGYDADKDGFYDTPPIAPAMWHSFHIGGEYAAVAIMAAVSFRDL